MESHACTLILLYYTGKNGLHQLVFCTIRTAIFCVFCTITFLLLRSKRASRNEMPFYSININCEPIRSGKTASERIYSDLHADIPGTPDSSAQVADGNAVTHAVNIALLLSDRRRDKADTVDHIVALDLFH